MSSHKITADIFAVLLRYFKSSIGNLIIIANKNNVKVVNKNKRFDLKWQREKRADF